MDITAVAWSNSGTIFAASVVATSGRCQLRFFTFNGQPIRTLNIPAQSINSLSFNATDSQLALALDNSLALAQIIPKNPYAYLQSTLVYSASRPTPTSPEGFDIVYFNHVTNSLHVKRVSRLFGLASNSSYVLLAAGSPDNVFSDEQWPSMNVPNSNNATVSNQNQERVEGSALIITDHTGIPKSTIFIPFEPKFVAITDSYAIAISRKKVAIWDYPSSLKNTKTNQSSHNLLFNTDEKEPNVKFLLLKHNATAIAARGNVLLIAYETGELALSRLPQCDELARYTLLCIVESIAISSDMTRVSFTDIYGNMYFLDIHSGTVAGQPRRETWSMCWADDSPSLFVALERQHLYVYRDFEAEEPILSLSYVLNFTNLQIITCDFLALYRNHLKPRLSYFHTYDAKPLRDLRLLISSYKSSNPGATITSISRRSPQKNTKVTMTLKDEIIEYVHGKSHPKLWNIIADEALQEGDLQLASKAFIEANNQDGISFMERVNQMPEGSKAQKGLIEAYLGQYDQAEMNLSSSKRSDLVLRMYVEAGNWKAVADHLVGQQKGNEVLYKVAHTALGEEAFSKGDWAKAAQEFALAGEGEKQILSLIKGDDFKGLYSMVDSLKPNNPLLKEIGFRFVTIGAHQEAVETFMKMGDVNTAIDACAHLNQWNIALQLAKDNPGVDKRMLTARYAHYLAENNHISAAINFFVKFSLPKDAAIILLQEGENAYKITRRFVHAKKCYVFAALLLEENAKKDPDSLIDAQNAWFKAEALHFLLLAHQQMYNENWEDALINAARIFYIYSDFIGKDTAAALLALCGFHSGFLKQCSVGFIHLEHSTALSKKKREKMEGMSIKIFAQNPPNDVKTQEIVCNKCQNPFAFPNPRCSKCGTIIPGSIVSGQPITKKKDALWKCTNCNHKAFKSEIKDLTVCPLCHHLLV